MRALIAIFFGWAAGQITQSGCNCKSSSEVKWRLAGGEFGGGFSHYGCGTGPYEDKSPAQGQDWCDTQESGCNDGQGWDFCASIPSDDPEAVNVNTGLQNSVSSLSLKVNVKVSGSSGSFGSSGSSGTGTVVTTVNGCTCHPTSEVLLMQNGVRVGGGFSHTGCGTGPYENNSPGKGSPWCDTVETRCFAGWDLCVPPRPNAMQPPNQNSFPPQNQLPPQNSFPPLPPQNSYTPPLTQNSYTPPLTQSSYTPPLTQNSYTPPLTQNSYTPPLTQNSYTPPLTQNSFSVTNSFTAYSPQQPMPPTPYPQLQPWSQPPGYQPQPPAYQPANPFQPSYQPQPQPQSSSTYIVQTATIVQPRSPVLVPVPQQKSVPPQPPLSPFSSSRLPARQPIHPRKRRNPSRGGSDYDYDDSASGSPLLPLMLLKGASGGASSSSSSGLLPFMLASHGGNSGSSMLPMMMMMGSGGFGGGNTNPLAQFAMLNAFRREGGGDAEDAAEFGEVGQTLGFTRAVVSSETSQDSSDSAHGISSGVPPIPLEVVVSESAPDSADKTASVDEST